MGSQMLEHKARHLVHLSVGSGITIYQRYVRTAFQQMFEVIAVDGHLIVNGCQRISLTYIIWYERSIADVGGHIALVA